MKFHDLREKALDILDAVAIAAAYGLATQVLFFVFLFGIRNVPIIVAILTLFVLPFLVSDLKRLMWEVIIVRIFLIFIMCGIVTGLVIASLGYPRPTNTEIMIGFLLTFPPVIIFFAAYEISKIYYPSGNFVKRVKAISIGAKSIGVSGKH